MKTLNRTKISSINHHETLLNHRIKNIKKEYGIFFTPEWVVDFMVSLIEKKEESLILEPACGLAQFLLGIKKKKLSLFKKSHLFGVEINKKIIEYLSTLKYDKKIELDFHDYLLWKSKNHFDLVIGNPPYGIPGNSYHYPIKIDPKTKVKYRELYQTWHGKYNVYGAFIEKSVKLLRENGQLIFIVPATFMILDDFKKLRRFLSSQGFTQIIYMGPAIFKPEAAVASVILNFKKSSSYMGKLKLMRYKNSKVVQLSRNDNWKGEVIKFESKLTTDLSKICSYNLGNVYDIRISPRTPEIKVKYNNYIISGEPPNKKDYLPILNGRNLNCTGIIYESRTGYWIKKSDIKKLRTYFSAPHIVVGLGFRGNGNVAAAYDKKVYPWMGDVYHLLKKETLFINEFDLTDYEVVKYLNSEFVKKYIADTYREVTYHLSITQLKSIPLPATKELKQIKERL